MDGDILVSNGMLEQKGRETNKTKIYSKKEKDKNLCVLEEQLELAETKCNVLKKQVDYMKTLYEGAKDPLEFAEPVEMPEISSHHRMQRVFEPKVQNILNDFKDGFVSKLAENGTEHVGKDPKDVVQIILNGMSRSINEFGVSRASSEFIADQSEMSVSKEITMSSDTQRIEPNPNPEPQPEIKIKKIKPRQVLKRTTESPKRQPKSKLGLRPVKAVYKFKNPPIDNQVMKRKKVLSKYQSYQLPTLSYRLKCVPKSILPYRIRPIPFVAGTSLNKSHNLGMKVQETLSLIKLNTRSSQMTLVNPNEEFGNLLNNNDVPYIVPRPITIKNNELSRVKKTASVGSQVQYKNYQLRSVLVNLHDQFSTLSDRYDNLVEKVKFEKNEETERNLKYTEEELNAKEREISAIMGLYNEITELKGRLSLVEKYPSRGNLSYTESLSVMPPSSTSVKMVKLLRKIERFQDNLRQKYI